MSMRHGKLKRCHGISETAACSMGHPFVPIQPEQQTQHFQVCVRRRVGGGRAVSVELEISGGWLESWPVLCSCVVSCSMTHNVIAPYVTATTTTTNKHTPTMTTIQRSILHLLFYTVANRTALGDFGGSELFDSLSCQSCRQTCGVSSAQRNTSLATTTTTTRRQLETSPR